jgi:hypothetical protein
MEPSQGPADQQIVFEDQGQGFDKFRVDVRRGERGKVKPYRVTVTGDEFHRDTGERRRVERVIDREQGRYWERITDPAGKVVREVEEPLRDHRDRGAAKPPAAS